MAEIELSRGLVALVDDEDMEKLIGCKWYANTTPNGNTYAQTRLFYKRFYMHRVVVDAPVGHHVHHKNENTLDNRKANLIVLSPAEHRFEHHRYERSGVYFDRNVGKYRAAIRMDGRRYNLGLHENKTDALNITSSAKRLLPTLPPDERTAAISNLREAFTSP